MILQVNNKFKRTFVFLNVLINQRFELSKLNYIYFLTDTKRLNELVVSGIVK